MLMIDLFQNYREAHELIEKWTNICNKCDGANYITLQLDRQT